MVNRCSTTNRKKLFLIMSAFAICHSFTFSNALSVCSRLLEVMIPATRVQLVQVSLFIFHCI